MSTVPNTFGAWHRSMNPSFPDTPLCWLMASLHILWRHFTGLQKLCSTDNNSCVLIPHKRQSPMVEATHKRGEDSGKNEKCADYCHGMQCTFLLCWGSMATSDGEGVESLGRPGIGDMGGRQWKERTRKWRWDELTYSLGLSCTCCTMQDLMQRVATSMHRDSIAVALLSITAWNCCHCHCTIGDAIVCMSWTLVREHGCGGSTHTKESEIVRTQWEKNLKT